MTKPANQLTIDLPFPINDKEAKEMIFAAMFGQGMLSAGKAAELLDLSKSDFFELASKYGVSVFSEDEEDLKNALNIVL